MDGAGAAGSGLENPEFVDPGRKDRRRRQLCRRLV